MNEIITLDYGSGGKKTAKLIEQTILPKLDNPALRALGDGAVVPGGTELAFSPTALWWIRSFSRAETSASSRYAER